MARPAIVQTGRQEEIRIRLVALAVEADKLQSATEDAYASRDLMRPLVRKREALKLQLSAVNCQVPRDTIKAQSVEQRIKACNKKINKAVEPFSEFTMGVRSLVNQLKSAFRFLPHSTGAQELRKEIEKLGLLMRGLGNDWTDARDDLLAIGMRLSELTAQSRQGSPSLRIEIPAGTKWENIQIRFLGDETIEIKAPNLRQHFNFAELGFEDRRTLRTPNTTWSLLRTLALAKDNEIPRPVGKPAQVEKGVQALRNRLRDLFGLDDDPFLPYRKAKCYTPKFKLSILSSDGN